MQKVIEARAVLVHGPSGKISSLIEAAANLRDFGISAIVPQVHWVGVNRVDKVIDPLRRASLGFAD